MEVKQLSFVVLLALFVSQGASALDLRKLYEFSVPVRDQGTEERSRGFNEAFRHVLVALTGNRNIVLKETLLPLIQNPDRFVKQFRYQSAPAKAVTENLPPQGDAVPPQPGAPPAATETDAQLPTTLLLWVQFDENAVRSALNSVNECVWARRQEVLIWLVVEQNGQRSLVSVESEDEFRVLLNESSDRRGLPLLFPLYDLEDQMQLKMADLWGNFAGPILATSRRYRTDAIVVGRVSLRFGNSWEGRWSLYENNNVDHWNSMGGSLAESLAGGIDGAADTLASRYHERFPCGDTSGDSVLLTVTKVKDMRQFINAQKYLESLQSVESLSVESISADRVQFSISLRGTAEDLTRSIGRDAKMVPVNTGSDELEFRLLP